MGLDENGDTGKDRRIREQEFGREGVTDMVAPALVGQGVQVRDGCPPRPPGESARAHAEHTPSGAVEGTL